MLRMFPRSQYKVLYSLIKQYENYYNANDHTNMNNTGNQILIQIYGLPQELQSGLFKLYLSVISSFMDSNTKINEWKQMLKSPFNYNFIVHALSPISQQLFRGIVPKKVRYTKRSICPVVMAPVLEKMVKELRTANVSVTLTSPSSAVNKSVNKKTDVLSSNVSISLGGIQLQSKRQGVDNSTIEFMFGHEGSWIPIEAYKRMGSPFRIVDVKNKTMQRGQYNTVIMTEFNNMKFKFDLRTAAPAAINRSSRAQTIRKNQSTGSENSTASIGDTIYMKSIANFTARQDYGTRHVSSEFNFKILKDDLLNDSDMCEGIALLIVFSLLMCYF